MEQIEIVRPRSGAPVGGAARIRSIGGQCFETRTQRARLGRPIPEEPPGQPVVGECHGGHPLGVVRLGVAQPAQLGGGERRDGNDAHPPGVVVRADLGGQVASCRGGAGVVPEQGVADDAALRIEHHHAVLLSGDRHRRDVVETAGVVDGGEQRIPPGGGVDLRPIRMPGAARAHDGSGLQVAYDDFAALGRRVDSGDEGHAVLALHRQRTGPAQRAPSRCSSASCCRRTNPKPLPPKYAPASNSSYAVRSPSRSS